MTTIANIKDVNTDNIDNDNAKLLLLNSLDKLINKEVESRLVKQKLLNAWKDLVINIYVEFLKEKESNLKILSDLRSKSLDLNALEYEGFIRGFTYALDLIDGMIVDWDELEEGMLDIVQKLAKEKVDNND